MEIGTGVGEARPIQASPMRRNKRFILSSFDQMSNNKVFFNFDVFV